MRRSTRRRLLLDETRPLAHRVSEIERELSGHLRQPVALEPVAAKGGADSVFLARTAGLRGVRAVVRVTNPHRRVVQPAADRAWRVLLPGPARIDAEWIAYRRLAAGGLSPEPLWRTHDASACAHVAGVRVSRRLVRRRGLVWRYLDETLTLAAAAHRRGVTHLDLNLGNIIDGRVGAGRRPRHADAGTLKLIDFEYGPPDGMSSATQRQLDVLTLLDEFARKRRGGRRLARDPGRFSAAVERGVPAAVRASDSGLRLDRFRHLSRSPRLHACVVRAFPRLRAV